MTKTPRVIYTRGNAAETPNWRFGLTTCVPRKDVPELCQGLDFIARERNGGSYYYPDYPNKKMAAAFEWYLPYRRWKFGYKVGVEFWIDGSNLEQIGAYVVYGTDHPKKGIPPNFTVSEQREFQSKVIEAINLATDWRTQLPLQQFYPIAYLRLPDDTLLKRPIEIPSLNGIILPTVLMGKDRVQVSAVIQSVRARFREEAKAIGAEGFLRLCALLTLATGRHHEPLKSTFGRTSLREFVDSVSPIPPLQSIYPKGKYKNPVNAQSEFSLDGLKLVSDQYSRMESGARSNFNDCLFAYYTAKDLLGKRFATLAVVALFAASKPFRGTDKCDGSVVCSTCGSLNFRHDKTGEASSISERLCDLFGVDAGGKKRGALRQVIGNVYKRQRSAFVHDAVFRHGEFSHADAERTPTQNAAISEQLITHNQLLTLEFLTRRALLQHLANLTTQHFDPLAFGIEPDKFEVTLGSMCRIVVGSKYWVGIRAMGRF